MLFMHRLIKGSSSETDNSVRKYWNHYISMCVRMLCQASNKLLSESSYYIQFFHISILYIEIFHDYVVSIRGYI